jgi:CRISPR/Cas system-associated exonuclease Cas4 (RecB family)
MYETKKQFLFNPNPKSFDVYIDKNPRDTIHIKYTTLEDVKRTIDILEKLYKNKQYTHMASGYDYVCAFKSIET